MVWQLGTSEKQRKRKNSRPFLACDLTTRRSVIHLSMQTTKTYVRKTYTSQLFGRGDVTPHPVTQTALYCYPEEMGQLARNRGSKRDEVYEQVVVTETVIPISPTEVNALVMLGRAANKAARDASA